jgi:hypothetical protein
VTSTDRLGRMALSPPNAILPLLNHTEVLYQKRAVYC